MGLRTPATSGQPQHPPNGPQSLPGIRRVRSGGNGPPNYLSVVPVTPPNNTSRRLSQATLHKIFVAMMGTVFTIYVVMTVVLIQYQSIHHASLGLGGGRSSKDRNGRGWGPSLEDSDKTVRQHIATLREQAVAKAAAIAAGAAAKDVLKNGFSLDNVSERKVIEKQQIPHPAKQARVVDLEEVDIHEMKHPLEIVKAKGIEGMVNEVVAIGKVKIGTNVSASGTRTDTMEKLSSSGDQRIDNYDSSTSSRILKAYLEPIYLNDWESKPLPIRNSTKDRLIVIEYPRVNSCQRLAELWPTDDFPDVDSFLPWIHDVFPTDDGRFVQVVAQNKRRCNTGTTPDQVEILEHMQPQIALFQHVPVQRIRVQNTDTSSEEIRYKLTSHEEADPDGIETRFICQFSDGQETLSQFNFNYDYAAHRKYNKQTFTKEGHKDNKSIHTSQLIFRCPVPENLVETVREGRSVVNDKATLFVTIVPIRTPPRYGAPDRFLPPRYSKAGGQHISNFTVVEEWGDSHILPRIEDSGRWENIPICLPTWKAFPDVTGPPLLNNDGKHQTLPDTTVTILKSTKDTKKNRAVACTWASTSYATRGDRYSMDDGARRLDEWIRFHLMVGFDHVFVYDNSHGENNLSPVTEQFSNSRITRIPWPATICNNNRSFMDSPGERSSQYAAESACRLRFGPHTDWMANMDIDEYIAPVGQYKSIKTFLDGLDEKNTKIVSLGSWRAWPRRDLIEPPIAIVNKTICEQPHPCFKLKVPQNRSILQTYNCDRQLVKKESMPAEKQIYRTDYVLQHYVHFSTVTLYTAMNVEETKAAGMKFGRSAPDPLSRFANEVTEVTMLHTKSVATQDTAGWQKRCMGQMKGECRIGVPFPDLNTSSLASTDDQGWMYNCYVNPKIERYWAPRLDSELEKSKIIDFSSNFQVDVT
jgi:hypothetical protein